MRVHVLVMVTDRSEEVGEVVIMERVVDVASVAPCAHQTEGSQQPQVMGGRAQAQVGRFREPLDGALPPEQLREEVQATR